MKPTQQSTSDPNVKPTPRLSFNQLLALVCVSATLLGAGCATNGRHVLLKEYGPTGPAKPDQPLKGITVCIGGFQVPPSITSPDPTTKPEEPTDFKFVEFTSEQSKAWGKEFKDLKRSTSKADWREIGNLRNGFGMVMSHIYALNDPAAWLAETLKLDLESQGAKVVDTSQADSADLSLAGTLRFCRVDMYMKIWGDLILDLELQVKGGTPTRAVLHTAGGTVGWVGATSEFYRPLRECRQKLSYLVTREITKAVKQ